MFVCVCVCVSVFALQIIFQSSAAQKESNFSSFFVSFFIFIFSSSFLQSFPAALVARVLDPRAGERVLDMCAAPGGK